MEKLRWFSAKVIEGKKLAQKIGYPTLNLDAPELLKGKKEGVYAALVKIKGKQYKGLLYFGPRLILGEKENVLEIFVFDLHQEIYGEKVQFQIVKYLRGVLNFSNFDSFKEQLEIDCQKAWQILK